MTWPKLTVGDYPEMLRKLSTAFFLVSLGCLSFLRSQIPYIDHLFASFDYEPPVAIWTSISVPFGTFVAAAVLAFTSESIKLHDKISNVLGLRLTFDVRWVLLPMALLSGASIERSRFDRVTGDRRRLMADVFYKYASSAKKAEIDGHLITQALTAWSWYWLCVESMTMLTLTAAVFALFWKWGPCALVLFLMLAMTMLMRVFKAEAKKYAEDEVFEISGDNNRRQEIRTVFDAL